ncbi:hypothetical protein K492DRAFT_205659 [Lichtheimia hyalospora FSU 10163]|nr:hypothetical protein K492DRAFT_205659 [Lichtheimia hyalospora FSU 10163]
MDKDTVHYSSAASEKQGDILTAMGVPWLDPHSCDPMLSMLHSATSTTPSVGLIPPSATNTPTTTPSTSSSGVSTPIYMQQQQQQQSDVFWQAPTNGTLSMYATPPPSDSHMSLQLAHRRSMPEIKQPYQNISTRRQRRRTEGALVIDDNDDEQRRQMFLERNRQAAFKCRLRKKQWLTNLQNQVEYMDADNRQLEHQILRLREEILNLKTLIVAHKDCPIAKQHAKSMGFTLSSINHQQQAFNPPPSIH